MIYKLWSISSYSFCSLFNREPSVMFVLSLAAIFTMVFSPVHAIAQTTRPTDNGTPAGLAPGSPTGSYSLSDFEDINLFNGSLNFSLPILSVGGRGSAGYLMRLNIQQRWLATQEGSDNQIIYIPEGSWPINGASPLVSTVVSRFPPFVVTGPGALFVRQQASRDCIGEPAQGVVTHTDLKFTALDGTEYVLRDQIYDGQSRLSTCAEVGVPGGGIPRGTVFVTNDGTAMTFISDSPIHDAAYNGEFAASGHLRMRDGTCYRFDQGKVTWIRDRNGNIVSFSRNSQNLNWQVTDPINRQVSVEYNVSDVVPYGLCDRIRFKGASGIERIIRISKTTLSQVLRTTQAGDPSDVWTYGQLFQGLNASGTVIDNVSYNPGVYSALWLPDGRSYQFKYNVYGELARVTFPSGGAVEYGFDGGQYGVGTPSNGVVNGPGILRRLVARRVYTDGGVGANYELLTTYSKPSGWSGSTYQNLGYVVVDQYAPGNSQPLTSEKHYIFGDAGNNISGFPADQHYPAWKEGREWKTESLDGNGAALRRIEHTWQQRTSVSWFTGPPDFAPPKDPRIAETVKTLVDANLVSKQTFGYDQYNNQTDIYEHAFGAGAPGPLIRRNHTDFVTFNNGVAYAADTNIHIRNLALQKQVFDAGGTKRAETIYEYDNYNSDGLHAPLSNCPNISGHDGTFSAGYLRRGNVTRISRTLLDNNGGATGSINSYPQHDIAGNVVKVIDSKGNATHFDFRDNFGSPDDPSVQSSENPANNAPGELGGQMSYAFLFKITNALEHKSYTKYDYHLGMPALSEDPNGVKSSTYFNDALDRPTKVVRAIGTTAASQTVVVYNDSGSPENGYPARSITTISDKDVLGESSSGNGLKSVALYDGFGRTFRVAAYEGSTWSIRDTRFDALGRVSQVSNPYRAADPDSASPPANLWTTTEYDALGRLIKMTTPDSAHVDTAYSGNQTTITDQAGKKRQSKTDALGRLVEVIEDPGGLGYVTSYLYDALDKLRKVTQGTQTQGTQTRLFAYDSLLRLIRVKNPEQNTNGSLPAYADPVTGGSGWSMAYSYDANGNINQKIDARGVVANYSYDALNRNTEINYVGGSQTRSVRIIYDGAVNGKGRLHYEWTQEGGVNATETKIDSYDALGRPLNKGQSFWRGSDWGTSYVVQQGYDLAGNLKTVRHPSGRTANYSYDQAGRLNSFTGNLGDGVNRNYATGMQYDATGSMKREQFGTTTPLYHRRHYNNRLQLFDIRLGTDPNPLYDSEDLDAWQGAAGSWNRGALRLYYSTLDGCHVYGNGGTNNNGNPLRMDHHIPLNDGVSNFVMSIDRYDYDPLNRIKSVTELSYTKGASGEDVYQGVFRQAFLYDRWGNRTIDQANTTGGVNEKAYMVDTATNRLTSVDGVAISYDAAGNQTNDGSGERIYDGENRLAEAKNNAGVRVSWYVYDAAGKRVVRTVGAQGTWQIYGIGGELLAEYAVGASPSAPQKEYGYRDGKLLVVWDGGETGERQLQWLVQDHLGSTRMVVDRSGSLGGVRRHDFAPFGEELSAGVGIRSVSNGYSGDSVRQKFTSHERDDEIGLDFMQSRYYANLQGRFTSVDPILSSAKPGAPQSWNRYVYVLNNPLRLIDPTGEQPIPVDISAVYAYSIRPTRSSLIREGGFFLRHPGIAMQIGSVQPGSSNISTVATRFAGRIGLGETRTHEGSEVNAFRHVLWQARIAASFGQSIARQVGAAHEENPTTDLSVRTFSGVGAGAQADQTADLLNNQIGREIAAAHPNASTQQLALLTLDYFHTEGLFTTEVNAIINPDGSSSVISATVTRTTITDVQYANARNTILGLTNFGRTLAEQARINAENRRRREEEIRKNDKR